MSEMLPKGWVKTTFADISVYIQRGKSPKYIDYSSLPVINQKAIRWNGLIEGWLKYINPNQINDWGPERYIQTGDILWNSTGTGTIGRACYVTAEMAEVAKVVDSHVTIVRTSPYIAPIFCFRYIQSHHIQNIIESLYTGSTNQVELSKEKINAIEIPLPPLNEQKRIVAKLDAIIPRIDSVKARLEKVPAIIKRFRQSVLTVAVTGKLTEKWREEHGIKDQWEEIELNSIIPKGGIFDGPFGSNLKTSDYTNKGVRVIRLENIGHLFFIHEKNTYVTKEKYQTLIRHTVGEGDIIFSSFIAEEIRACILPELSTKAIAKADCFCVRPDESKINKKFLLYSLVSFNSYQQLVMNIHGATRPRINTTQLKKVLIPYPPLEEQKEIVRQVDRLFSLADKLEAHYQKAKIRIDKLSQSVLAKAFRGELVPQDPDDEPAEKLLKRIMAEKAKMEGGGQKTGGRTQRAKV
jgi:type I restriction enzyme S subunit